VPQFIAGLIAPLLVSSGITALIGASAASALALGIGYVAVAGALYLASSLLMQNQNAPSVPKPDDGSYNLKQSATALPYVLGRAKKGGDYVFLEAQSGIAYHIIVEAGHRIHGFVQHYLHDEAVTLDGSGNVVSPSHFAGKVNIQTRLGAKASTAYADIAATFPSIWTADHRGDGLASVRMICSGVSSEDYLDVYPNQMPSHSCVIDGALLYDPRTNQNPDDDDTWVFSTNIALERLWHLCHPVGAKLGFADMYMLDWIDAADCCDETVLNRTGTAEKRYHGGLWFRADNDPVDIGRLLDQAAELVVYERADGLIGVHPGRYVEPDIRLSGADIVSVSYDANASLSSQVLAVRGRYTSPADVYNTQDAAIFGDPYVSGDDTQRSKTVDNQVVQSHNHMQRLQAVAFKRSRAPRVAVKAHYEPARGARYRRFVRVHYPPRLDEAVIEITSAVKLSLRNLTVEFSGIVWSENYLAFNAAEDEGDPSNPIVDVVYTGVPVPAGFGVAVDAEVVSGGQTAAFATGSWTHVASTLTYEMQWQRADDSDALQSVMSAAGATSVRTGYLADGQNYKARLRTWSVGSKSNWTDWEYFTAIADVVPPGVATDVSASGGENAITFNWASPNSANYLAARLYLGTDESFTFASLVATEYGPAGTSDSRTLTGIEAGDYYGWVQAINVSGRPATAVATGPITVTDPE
jgi:hypothetical protein